MSFGAPQDRLAVAGEDVGIKEVRGRGRVRKEGRKGRRRIEREDEHPQFPIL